MNDFLKNDKINPVKMANNNVLDIKTHNISTSREMQKENPAKNSGNFCAEKKSTEKDHQAKKKYVRKKKAEERLAKKGVDLVAHKLARAAREMARQRTLDSFFQHEEYYVEGEWAHRLEVY
jgi:hypothetical protein